MYIYTYIYTKAYKGLHTDLHGPTKRVIKHKRQIGQQFKVGHKKLQCSNVFHCMAFSCKTKLDFASISDGNSCM